MQEVKKCYYCNKEFNKGENINSVVRKTWKYLHDHCLDKFILEERNEEIEVQFFNKQAEVEFPSGEFTVNDFLELGKKIPVKIDENGMAKKCKPGDVCVADAIQLVNSKRIKVILR